MRLNQPKKVVWWIALIVVIVGVVGKFVNIPVVTDIHFWLVLAGYVLLLLGTTLKGF